MTQYNYTLQEGSPLGIVQDTLWRHTDRNPDGPEAIMRTIDAAVDTLGDEESLMDKVKRSLDPATPGGLGLAGIEQLERIGELTNNPDAERVQRWGALSLLGVLAMTYRPELHGAEPPAADAAEYRAQTCAVIARRALLHIIEITDGNDERHHVVQTFLSHTPIPGEDVATELEIMDLPALDARAEALDDELHEETPIEAEQSMQGCRIGEPCTYQLTTLNPNVQRTIDAMDWLREDLDLTHLTGRQIWHDGTHVATVVDLTPGKTQLNKLMRQVEARGRDAQLWEWLGASVVGQRKPIQHGKVPTFYVGNYATSNANIMRGYYVLLGKVQPDVEIFGLVAGFLSKGPQRHVLELLATHINSGATIK